MHIDFSNLFIYIGDKPYLQCEEAKYIGDVDGGGGGGGVPRSHVEFNPFTAMSRDRAKW